MWNPFLKVEWLKEGRNIRLPMMLIFYNAILAFITILFMFFNAESFQEGYSYDTSAYLYQFLIISTIQIGMIFVLMPFSVWGFYSTDREKHMLEEFVMIPGSSKQFIIARVSVIIAVYMMLFISSLPIISLSCILCCLSVHSGVLPFPFFPLVIVKKESGHLHKIQSLRQCSFWERF